MNYGKLRLSVILLAASAICGGCGYSSRRPFPDGISTVHVEMLHSQEFRRELEFELTEALIKRIEMDTPYRIADRAHADTIFTGEIYEVRLNVLGKRFDTGTAREQGAQIAMRYQWKDQRSGEILVERPRFVHQVGYIPLVGESFDKGVRVRGIDQMAERIVETMETEW